MTDTPWAKYGVFSLFLCFSFLLLPTPFFSSPPSFLYFFFGFLLCHGMPSLIFTLFMKIVLDFFLGVFENLGGIVRYVRTYRRRNTNDAFEKNKNQIT